MAEGPSWYVPAGTRRVAVTPRDRELLSWAGRHGVVTALQIAEKFYRRADGRVGQRAAYNRLAALAAVGLIQRYEPGWRIPGPITVTAKGMREADLNLAPREPGHQRHALALVDLSEELLRDAPDGTTFVTEREIRTYQHRGFEGFGSGHRPDGLLITESVPTTAIELELTQKDPTRTRQAIAAYRANWRAFPRVRWFVLPGPGPRRAALEQLLRQQDVTDFMTVEEWRGFRWGSAGGPRTVRTPSPGTTAV